MAMKRPFCLITLGLVGAVLFSQTSSSEAKTVTVNVGATGDYTATVRDANNTTGVALVEAFQLQ